MEKLQLEKIITATEFIKGIEDISIISTISSIELNKLKRENYAKGNIHTRAREIASTGVYLNYTLAEREYIAVNIMYDNIEFIEFLLSLSINYKQAEKISETIEVFKNIKKRNPNDIIFKSQHYNSLLNLIERICYLAKKRFETQDDYLTINKLIYLVTYEQEQYKKLEQQKIKKPQ